ncbi:Nephrocystin-3 [Trichoplax sp. H2]|nr:Nephrocystin-3 [Trichoplax sp. H2]|eukprot:RDD40336.1 Nephrocystin-3 [Trichoplax sp. H2]
MADDESVCSTSVLPHHTRIQSLYEKGISCKTAFQLVDGLSCYTQAVDAIASLSNPSADIDRLACDIYLGLCDIYTLQYQFKEAVEWSDKGQTVATKLQDEVSMAQCLQRESEIKRRQGDFNGALEDGKKSLEMKLKWLDEKDARLADSYHQIGCVYWDLCKYEQAVDMHNKSLQIGLSVLGHNHPHVAKSYNNIGIVYHDQAKIDQAMDMYDKSLQIRLSVLGHNHPDVAWSYNNIGVVYDRLCKYDQAVDMYDKSLQIRLAVLGHNHPDVANSYNNIGVIYRHQGKYDQAVDMLHKSLQIGLAVLGHNHPHVANSYYNIGLVYHDQGKYDQAVDMYDKSLQIGLSVLGHNHPDVVKSYKNIGNVYKSQRKYDQAVDMYDKSLQIGLAVHGHNHPDVASSYNKIGNVYKSQGKYDQAVDMYDKSLQIGLAVLGHNHPDVANSYNNIGLVYDDQGKYDQAVDIYDKSLQIRLSVLGHNHPDVANSYNNIGNVYKSQGKYDQAVDMYHKSLQIGLAVLDYNHPDVANSYNDIGVVYRHHGKYDQAVDMYDKSLQIRLSVLGHNHPDVANSYNNIGNVYKSQGKYDQAVDMYDKSLQIRLSVLGHNHPHVAKSYNNIGLVYRRQGKYDQAVDNFKKSLYIATLSGNDRLVKWTKKNIDITLRKPKSSTSTARNWIKSTVERFQPNQINNVTAPANTIDGSHNNQHVQEKALQEKKYYNAYSKALKHGHCFNHLIRGMFIGPRNVGKTSVRKIFTKQPLDNPSPTQVAENLDIMVETEYYNIRNLEGCDWTEILDDKVKTVIQQLAQTSINSQDNISQQVTDIDPIENQNADKDENNQYVKIWDFAGHAVYHLTHYPFISVNSIYILVFNINQDINDKVTTRNNQLLKTTYLQAMQEWLTSIIAGHTSQSTINVNIKSEDEQHLPPSQHSLPIIILVASHGDCIINEENGRTRFNQFVSTLTSRMPSYANHIYSSGIIFNCNPLDSTPSTLEQRRQCCLRLHGIIKAFVQSLPFITNPIPIRWYIMARILNKSLPTNSNNQPASSIINQIRHSQVHNIMTMQQIVNLSQQYGLYENHDELIAMLMYLHDLGEVIYCDKVGDDGIIITNVDWLLNIFRSIIQLQDFVQGGAQIKRDYEIASQRGKLSRSYIDHAIYKFNLDDNSKQTILALMHAYDILCSITNEKNDNGEECQYFVPYLLRYDVKPFDLSKYHQSDWLYIGYEHTDIPYLPDGIYYCLLSSCLKEWNNTDVELYYQCAKYYLANDNHYLVVKKEESHIGLQYCYQKINEPERSQSIIDKVTNSIFVKRPHEIVKNKLISTVNDRMVKFKGADCRYFVKCSECNTQTSITEEYKEEDQNWIRCKHCKMEFASQSLNDWIIYNEKFLIDRWKDTKDEDPRKYFYPIASSIGTDWPQLAAILDPTICVKVIMEQNRDHVFNQAMELLNYWYKKAHPNVSISRLQRALQTIGRNDIILSENNEQNF